MPRDDRYAGTCAACGRNLDFAREIGESGIYNPGGPAFELCMPCWDAEEELTSEGNFHPEVLARYYATFGETRPKLYDVMNNRWV